MAKDTRRLVDPELLGLLEAWPQVELTHEVLPTMRSMSRLPMAPIEDPSLVEMTHHVAPGPKGAPDVPLIAYRPAGTEGALPCIYHIHGGGYVAGSAASLEPIHRILADELGCMLVSVDYRLAPETPHPGPVEDCYAGLAWLFANAERLGVDEAHVGVMGESAGGGLAAGLALLARDRGEYALAFQQLVYPMLDDRTCLETPPHPFAGEFIWTPHNNRFGWRCYLDAEPGGAGVSPYAAAARAEDLAGLPPAFISTGALDLFVDEDIEYARRLMRAGVATELHVYPGAYHGFNLAREAAVTRQAMRDTLGALRRGLGLAA